MEEVPKVARKTGWRFVARAAVAGVLTSALMFVGVGIAFALQPPQVVSTHTTLTTGTQSMVKATGVPMVYTVIAGGTTVGSLNTTTDATAALTVTGVAHRELDAADSGLVYLTSGQGIDVIDSATNSVVAFYPATAPRNYQSMAVDNATGRLFVSWTDGVGTSGVVILDAATGAELGTAFPSVEPLTQLAINETTGTLYGRDGNENVASFDVNALTPKAVSTVGNVTGTGNTNGVAIDPTNNRVIAIASAGGPVSTPDSVSVFDGNTMQLIASYDLGAAQIAQVSYMVQSNIAVVTFGGPQDPVMVDLATGATLPIDVVTGLTRGLFVDQENEFIYVTGTTNTTLTILAVPAEIVTPSVPDGVVGTAYSATIATQGSLPLTLAVTGGTLPPGLTLDPATGAITGTPTTPGTYTFTVTADNVAGSFPQDYTIVIADAPVVPPVTPPVTPPGGSTVVGTAPPMLAESGSSIPWVPTVVALGLLLAGASSLMLRRFARA